MNEGTGRPNLVHDIVKEMQSGMNMPNNGRNPVMGDIGGPNPMMGGGQNPMMGGGMGPGGMGPGMGGMGPGMGGMPPGGMGGGMGPGAMGGMGPGMQHGGVAPMPGMAPGLADPMGNSAGGAGDPILGYGGAAGAAYPGGQGAYMLGQGQDMQEYDEDDYEGDGQLFDLATLGTDGNGNGNGNGSGMADGGESDSFVDDLLTGGRDPIIVAILFALLSSPQFNTIFNQMVPRVGENILYSLGSKAALIAVLYFMVKYFLT